MDFSSFAKRLKRIISSVDASNGTDFSRVLFENILEIDDLESEISPSSFRAYYRGDRKLSRLVSKYRDKIEPEKFASYIYSFGEDVQRDIFKEFAKDCPGMTDQNVPEKMAELFKRILVDAMPVKKDKSVGLIVEEDESIDDSEYVLLNECGNKCPLCKKNLIETKKGIPIRKYKRVNILPLNLDNWERDDFERFEPAPDNLHGLDNQILLCNDCAIYSIDTTPSEYSELMRIKHNMVRVSRLDAEAYDISVEQGIDTILDALSRLNNISIMKDESSLKALRVDKKIPDNMMLQDLVTTFVLKYYRYIESQFKQREREGKLRFNKVKNEISQCFELYDEAELSQNEIFERLVEWLKEKSKCNNEIACIAMVSFFVQNCEVFRDETT